MFVSMLWEDIKCPTLSFSILLPVAGFLTDREQALAVLLSLSLIVFRLHVNITTTDFYVDAGDSNSGPCACTASALMFLISFPAPGLLFSKFFEVKVLLQGGKDGILGVSPGSLQTLVASLTMPSLLTTPKPLRVASAFSVI